MQILDRKPREGRIRLRAENADDLWELTHIIAAGDRVRARTERKIAVGGDRAKQVRKPMTLTIEVTDLTLEQEVLRVQGTIAEGPEDLVSFGDHHSVAIDPGTDFTIIKEWDALTEGRLEEAVKAKPLDILVVTFDRESACMAELTRRGYDVVQTLSGDVAKKAPGGGSEDFWKTLADAVAELDARRGYSRIVAASPAFWTDYLLDALPDALRKKTTGASCSTVGEAGIREVLKRPELSQALEADRNREEELLVAEVLEAVSKDNACYGLDECRDKARVGQVAKLVVSMALVERSREEGTWEEVDAVLEQAKGTGAEVRMIRHQTEQLDSIGGIAGVLRW